MSDPARRKWWAVHLLLVALIVALLLVGIGRCGWLSPGGPVGPPTDEPGEPTASTTPATGPGSRPSLPPWNPPKFTDRRQERDRMVQAIRFYGLDDEAVLKTMAAVPRHEFVPAADQRMAYADTPLPIGHGQTISQPYMVAEMTRLLKLRPGEKVLEIGTGSGYQAAVLTHCTRHVYTIEIVKPLAEEAAKRLKRLGYAVVQSRTGDGYDGWKDKGPFDGIVVTCAAGSIPPPLIKQLAPGGRMVIPVGPVFATQSLMLVEKDAAGTVRSRSLMAVRFVPLLRKDPTAR